MKKKDSKKIDKKIKKIADIEKITTNMQNPNESVILDLAKSFGEEQPDIESDAQNDYQQNVSAIEQDLQEVTQKDRLTEAYNQLYSDHNLEKITEIAPQDLGKISILLTYARQFKFLELENLILNNMRLRVSLRRKGREEHVKISQAEVLRDERQLKLAHKLDSRVNKG